MSGICTFRNSGVEFTPLGFVFVSCVFFGFDPMGNPGYLLYNMGNDKLPSYTGIVYSFIGIDMYGDRHGRGICFLGDSFGIRSHGIHHH